ncbi:MAG: VOC family protein [Gemmatimonadetes bacterium]|nr:VOC family protein [Gemmatimonadota bacterium]
MLTLDHVLIFAGDLDTAAQQYRRLGFSLTPRGSHPSLGTANHTIMFERDYLELITVAVPGPGNARWASIMAAGGGFGAVALATSDARATRAQLLQRGFEIPEVIDFARPVATDGGTELARFSVAHLPADASPALPGFFCQHHTRELVWLPAHQTHANTATKVVAMVVIHPDPAAASPGYERLLGRAMVHPHPGGLQIDLRGPRLLLVTPDFARRRLNASVMERPDGIVPIGVTIGVRRLERAIASLEEGRVSYRRFGRRSVIVDPEDACGVALELAAVA